MAGDPRLAGDDGTGMADVVHPERLARALRSPIRRRTLAVVLERQEPVPVDDLVSLVLDGAERVGGASQSGRRELRQAMDGRHVPLLAVAGLVERSGTPDLVGLGDHPILSRPSFEPARLREDATTWKALSAAVGQPRRRVAVRSLARLEVPTDLDRLARAVAAELVGEVAADADVIGDMATRLHHVDLPLLARADVIDYDAGERRVEAVSTGVLPVPVTVG